MAYLVVDNEVEREKQLKELAIEFAGEAVVGTDAAALKTSILSGGITNQLYRVKNETSGKSVVVRVFGKETERIISRDAELFWQSMFIKTFGRKGNALVYEFLDGYKDLDYLEMVKFSKPIAESMAQFHISASVAAMSQLPYATEVNFTSEFLTKWVDIATSEETVSRLTPEKQEQYNNMSLPKLIRKEAEELLAVLKKHEHNLPQGACHNDLLSANVMMKKKDGDENVCEDIRLIDFEYAKRNYLYYDIGNHFNEYTGLDCDYDTHFPKEAQRKSYISDYLKELRKSTQPRAPPLTEAELEKEVAKVDKYVIFCSGLSNVCWALWTVIQQAFSAIEFDYLSYGEKRWQRYLDAKEEFALNDSLLQ